MSSRSVVVDLDLLSCPICMDIPEKEVFQCTNGHIICHTCITNVKLCPQCSIPFGSNPIRSRISESILDIMDKNCMYAGQGCQQIIKKKDLQSHYKICNFRSVQLCANLGFKDCSFAVSTGIELRNHLRVHHKNGIVCRNGLNIKMDNFSDYVENRQGVDQAFAIVWSDKNAFFLASIKLSFDDNLNAMYSVVNLHLGKEPQNADRYEITSKISSKQEEVVNKYACNWTEFPLHFKDAEDAELISHFSVPVKFLNRRLGSAEGNVGYEFTLSCSANIK